MMVRKRCITVMLSCDEAKIPMKPATHCARWWNLTMAVMEGVDDKVDVRRWWWLAWRSVALMTHIGSRTCRVRE
jgi:hypothetical protein